MDEEVRHLENTNQYYLILDKVKKGTYPLLIPKNRNLIVNFLNDAEIGRTVLKGQKKKLHKNF